MERLALGHSGATDEDVDVAQAAEERLDAGLVGHVTNLVDGGGAATDRDDTIPGCTEALDDRPPDASAASGDDDEPAQARDSLVMTTFLYSSSRAVWPGARTSVVMGVHTIAGPGTRLPGRRRSKS